MGKRGNRALILISILFVLAFASCTRTVEVGKANGEADPPSNPTAENMPEPKTAPTVDSIDEVGDGMQADGLNDYFCPSGKYVRLKSKGVFRSCPSSFSSAVSDAEACECMGRKVKTFESEACRADTRYQDWIEADPGHFCIDGVSCSVSLSPCHASSYDEHTKPNLPDEVVQLSDALEGISLTCTQLDDCSILLFVPLGADWASDTEFESQVRIRSVFFKVISSYDDDLQVETVPLEFVKDRCLITADDYAYLDSSQNDHMQPWEVSAARLNRLKKDCEGDNDGACSEFDAYVKSMMIDISLCGKEYAQSRGLSPNVDMVIGFSNEYVRGTGIGGFHGLGSDVIWMGRGWAGTIGYEDVEESYTSLSHEMGHSFFACEEYDLDAWQFDNQYNDDRSIHLSDVLPLEGKDITISLDIPIPCPNRFPAQCLSPCDSDEFTDFCNDPCKYPSLLTYCSISNPGPREAVDALKETLLKNCPGNYLVEGSSSYLKRAGPVMDNVCVLEGEHEKELVTVMGNDADRSCGFNQDLAPYIRYDGDRQIILDLIKDVDYVLPFYEKELRKHISDPEERRSMALHMANRLAKELE